MRGEMGGSVYFLKMSLSYIFVFKNSSKYQLGEGMLLILRKISSNPTAQISKTFGLLSNKNIARCK